MTYDIYFISQYGCLENRQDLSNAAPGFKVIQKDEENENLSLGSKGSTSTRHRFGVFNDERVRDWYG